MSVKQSNYTGLINEIGNLLLKGREQVAHSINTILVQTYWLIGRHIVEFEQGGKEKAEYGSNLLDQLSTDLTKLYGKGFSRSNVFQIRQFYLRFSKIQTLSEQFEKNETPSHILSWSHYVEILKSNNELEISFYVKQSENENWSVRELKRQMKSMLFHRLALSKDKKQLEKE
ncbi:MAG: hypothetical protein HYU67_07215 [Flavobacteriia bacterium]|nr:hypothetical protein [Flavobacteriia bacterium]